jgi:hypothetical protein
MSFHDNSGFCRGGISIYFLFNSSTTQNTINQLILKVRTIFHTAFKYKHSNFTHFALRVCTNKQITNECDIFYSLVHHFDADIKPLCSNSARLIKQPNSMHRKLMYHITVTVTITISQTCIKNAVSLNKNQRSNLEIGKIN